jgi:hypothetical protein
VTRAFPAPVDNRSPGARRTRAQEGGARALRLKRVGRGSSLGLKLSLRRCRYCRRVTSDQASAPTIKARSEQGVLPWRT